MRSAINLKTEGLAPRLEACLRLKWPNSELTCLPDESQLISEAAESDAVFLDDVTACPHGLEIVSRIREICPTAIIAMARRPCEEEMVNVLEAGADGYLPTSFNSVLLVARLSAVLRRSPAPFEEDDGSIGYGHLQVNRRTRQGYLAGHELHLTRTEFEVLNILARAGDSLVTNHTFQKLVWQTDELLYRESLRKYIQRLRHKLETQPDADLTIVAVHGMGYRLAHLHDSPASRHCAKSS